MGWYEGFHLLLAVNAEGIMTGYGFGSASSKDQALAETFFALRIPTHNYRLPSVGAPAQGPYVADKGFEGKALHQHWWLDYGAQLICPPKRKRRRRHYPELSSRAAGSPKGRDRAAGSMRSTT